MRAAIAGLGLLCWLGACSDDDASTCVPGRQASCPCPGGGQSVQVCNDEGSAFGACECAADERGRDGGSANGGGGRTGTLGTSGTGTGRADAGEDPLDFANAGSAARAGSGSGASGTSSGAGAGAGGSGEAGTGSTLRPPNAPEQLALRQQHPTGIAVLGTQVFWADESDGTVVGCEIAACGESERWTVVSGLGKPRGVALDDEALYFLDAGSDGMHLSVGRCPRQGCGSESPEMLFSADAVGTGLAVTTSELFVAAWDALLSCPLDGSCTMDTATSVAAGGGITGVAVDAEHVYFVRSSERASYRCPLAGCGPSEADSVQVGQPFRYALSIAVEGGFAYWTNYDYFMQGSGGSTSDRTIDNCPAAGCSPYAPGTVASGDVAPFGIALDSGAFYWTDYEKGQITRAPRPYDR